MFLGNFQTLFDMAISVVEFLREGYKIRKVLATLRFWLKINVPKENYCILGIGVRGSVKKCFQSLCQKSSESFWVFFFIEKYKFRSTFFVIGIF